MGELTSKGNGTQASGRMSELMRLLNPISQDLGRVETALMAQAAEFPLGVRDRVQFVLGGTGKRLRPSLALLAGGATGGVTDKHIILGVIVELIHIATLVHDDILDEAELRHGLTTANARWGNEISVLVGDCLFAHALKLAATHHPNEVCRKVSEASNAVCVGEILQTQRRFDLDLSVEQYLDIIRMKTGALFAVSCELGAFLNAPPASAVKSLSEFGDNLGVAYQIYDDCVDIFGHERQAGKSLGTDMKKGKLTLPLLLLLEHTGADKREEVGAMILNADPGERARLMKLVLSNGVVSESLATIDRYIGRARANLIGLPGNAHTAALAGMLDFIGSKSRVLLCEEVAA